MTRFVLADESDQYRQKRAELLTAEIALRDQVESVAALRRQLPLGKRMPDGAAYHHYTIGAEFDEHKNRGIDPYSRVWNLLDLVPAGRGDWYPNHDYRG